MGQGYEHYLQCGFNVIDGCDSKMSWTDSYVNIDLDKVMRLHEWRRAGKMWVCPKHPKGDPDPKFSDEFSDELLDVVIQSRSINSYRRAAGIPELGEPNMKDALDEELNNWPTAEELLSHMEHHVKQLQSLVTIGESMYPTTDPVVVKQGTPEPKTAKEHAATIQKLSAQKEAGRGIQYKAIQIVRAYVETHLEVTDPTPEFQVYVVWFVKVLQNWKALVSTSLPDGMYYELTYDGDKSKVYVDAYKKFDNVAINVPTDDQPVLF